MSPRSLRLLKSWVLAALIAPLMGRVLFMAVYGAPFGLPEKGRASISAPRSVQLALQPRARHRRRISALNLVSGFTTNVRIAPPPASGIQDFPAPGSVPPEPSAVPQHPPA